MKQSCKFNEVTDITPVNPDLGVDLKESIRSGIIRDTSSECFYNQQKELGDIGCRLHDEFDFIHYDNALRTYRKKKADKKKADK